MTLMNLIFQRGIDLTALTLEQLSEVVTREPKLLPQAWFKIIP